MMSKSQELRIDFDCCQDTIIFNGKPLVVVRLPDGRQVYFTPGNHNELQIAIIEKFGPRFAPNSTVLYVGDAANKFVIYEQERLAQLGFPITTHDKFLTLFSTMEKRTGYT